VFVNGSYRVASFTDGVNQTTNLSYDTANNRTTITDPLGVASVYQYDSAGQLTQVRTGVTASNPNGLTQANYSRAGRPPLNTTPRAT
jgi:YD repeat-containing protein